MDKFFQIIGFLSCLFAVSVLMFGIIHLIFTFLENRSDLKNIRKNLREIESRLTQLELKK